MPRRTSNDSRGPRPAKIVQSVRKTPSPESPLSDNASDNSDLFQWSTLDCTTVTSVAPSFAAINASRKRKLLEQYFGNESQPGPLSTPPPPRPRSPRFKTRFMFSSHRSHSDDCQHSSTESLCSTQDSPIHKCQQGSEPLGGYKLCPGKRFPVPQSESEASGKEICHESEVKQNLWSRDILEDIDNNLAADFDGSLSGLGVDLSAASYNMSEALLALPSLTVFKEEVPSPSHTSNNDGKNMLHLSSTVVGKRPNTAIGTEFASFSHLLQTQHFWHHQSSGFTNESHALTSGVGTGSVSSLASSSSVEGNPSRDLNALGSCSGDILHDYKYQYTLGAATSVATKMNEENLAYLNQGQSYELKLRRFGREGEKGKMLKSVVRLCFHDRRLQYMEKEQIMAWRQANPGSRILEIDIPLSYGITDVIQDQVNLNAATFTWDPAKEVGVFIKVHCISTEFTPKKHGGEKGVPFRLQLESFDADDPVAKRHHAAACQIKVFKLKGGDRKHKQDREKLMKRPPSEQEKYQPQSRFTLFTDIPVESLTSLQSTNDLASAAKENQGNSNPNKPAFYVGDNENPPRLDSANETVSIAETNTLCSQVLRPESTSTQVFQWLQANRFGSYNSLFNFFSGADMLRLTRDDFVQVVGVADGIRLFNSLHSKPIIPRLTLYVSVNQKQVYNAIYMPVLNCSELRSRLLLVMQLSSSKLKDVFLWGPGGIHILVTDEVVQNFKNDSSYNIEIVKEKSDDYFSLVLKPLVNY